MIKRLTIRLRLIACMAFLGILLVVIGGVGINGIRTVNAALQDVYQKQMASALKLAEAKNFLNRSRFVIDRGVFHPEAPDLEKRWAVRTASSRMPTSRGANTWRCRWMTTSAR